MVETTDIETGDDTEIEAVEIAEEIAEEVAEEVAEEIDPPEVDVDVTVIEDNPPEIPETSYVDVGDLHISGPPEMVERITSKYLKDHIDHNPHDIAHTQEVVGDSITPDVVEEQIQESVSDETVDAPPGADDWLFRNRGGQ